MERLISLLGIVVLVAMAFALSNDRKSIRLRPLAWGFALQFLLALLVLKTAAGRRFFSVVNDVIVAILGYTQDGARFVFGNLIDHTVPVTAQTPGANVENVSSLAAETAARSARTTSKTSDPYP